MKKFLIALFVVFSVFTFPCEKVNADFFCDDVCLTRAINGELSPTEVQYYGVGNLVKTVAGYFNGDVWKAMKVLGLASNTYVADTTVNVVYDVNFEGNIFGIYQCQPGYQYCSEGQLLGYYQEDENIIRVICTPNGNCSEEVLLENQPTNLLEEVFNQSHYYGGPGEWE